MEGLNVCLEKLDTYCVTWQLEVNIKKSKVMIFNQTGRLIIGQNLFFQGQKLEIVKTYCYLGVEISCSGAFGRARDCLTEKAHKAMFPLKAMINQFQLSNENSLKLFHSFISPILLYNAENLAQLSHRQISDLEDNRKSMSECLMNSYINSNHYKFLKYVLGVKPNCSNIAILGELGEFPLMARAWIALLSYWHRSTQMGEKTLVNKALKVITENDHKQSEWLSTIKIIMSKLGLLEVFRHPSRTKSNKLKEICAKKIKDLFCQEWRTLLCSQTGKLRFYKTFKQEFAREKYLDDINCFQIRKIITKFRCSDHRLEIELGRHGKGTPEVERRCKICLGNVETETHFLAECPLYHKLRTKYFGNDVRNKINDILKCRNKAGSFNLANYLTKAYEWKEYMLRMRSYFK